MISKGKKNNSESSSKKEFTEFKEITRLGNFVAYYKEKLKKEENRLILAGRGIRNPTHRLDSPPLKLVNNDLITAADFGPRFSEHYYINLRSFSNGSFGLYYKLDSCGRKNYGERGIFLRCEVVSRISLFWASSEKIKGGKRIELNLKDMQRQRFGWYYSLFNNAPGQNRRSCFNIKYDDALRAFRKVIPPYWILSCPGPSRSQKADSKEYLDLNGVGFCLEELDDPHKYGVISDNDKILITAMDATQLDMFFWREEVSDDLFRRFNRELLEYLNDNELPALRAIMREFVIHGSINDSAIGFLNEMQQLKELSLTNALNRFICDIFDSFSLLLCKRNILIKCPYCGNLFRYKEGKKYCSMRAESRDCGKAARNRRDYQKHRNKRQDYYGSEMKINREFLRKVSIKKE